MQYTILVINRKKSNRKTIVLKSISIQYFFKSSIAFLYQTQEKKLGLEQ